MTAEDNKAKQPKTIRLDDDFIIKTDLYGYMLINTRVIENKKTGIEHTTERVVGYYYDLADALKDYVRHTERIAVIDRSVRSITELIDILSEKEKTLRETALSLSESVLENEGRQK